MHRNTHPSCANHPRLDFRLLFRHRAGIHLRADQFDTLRLYWQNYLISNGGSVSSIANTANGYWSSMNTNASRTYLWSDLPFGSVSANIPSTYSRLQAMALAWATPGSSLQNNAGLAARDGEWVGLDERECLYDERHRI